MQLASAAHGNLVSHVPTGETQEKAPESLNPTLKYS